MKIQICMLLAVIMSSALGCSSGSSGAAATTPPTAVVGLDTPKSVAVVTAN